VFPSYISSPRFIWSDPIDNADTRLIDVVSGNGHLYILTQTATPPPERDSDPRNVSKEAADYKPPTTDVLRRQWTPSIETKAGRISPNNDMASGRGRRATHRRGSDTAKP
jgi:hypothetical protein